MSHFWIAVLVIFGAPVAGAASYAVLLLWLQDINRRNGGM